jgi:hypothetical protein
VRCASFFAHQCNDRCVLAHTQLYVFAFGRQQRGDIGQTLSPLLFDIDDARGGFKELRQARYVVANIIAELGIARRGRAVPSLTSLWFTSPKSVLAQPASSNIAAATKMSGAK